MKFMLNEYKKFILEEKFTLEEKFVLNEKIDSTKYPNIIKFFPEAAIKDSSWGKIGLPDVSKFDQYMKKDLEEYFGANWITKEQCAELIKMAAKNKPNGNNFSETKALFNQFKQAADKEAERLKVLEKRLDDTFELIAPLKESILEHYKRLLDKKETLKTDADEFSKLVINFLPSVSSITDLTIIQTRIQTFIDQLRQNSFFKTVKDEAFIQAFNRVNSLLEIKLTNDETKNILKSRLDASMKELKKATETAKNNVIKAFVNSDLVDQIKTASEEVINLLTSYENLIKENKAKMISNEAFIESFENAIKDLVAFITRNVQNKSFEEELNETVEKFNTFTGDTKTNLSTTLNSSGEEKYAIDFGKYSPTGEDSVSISQDWDREYRNATNKDAFWGIYINKVWNKHVDKINAISKALKLECVEYGFKPELNPFLSYINNYYLNPEYNMLPQAYFAIHDAVAGNIISEKDLDETTNKYKSQDIIFCKSISKKSSQDVLDYIKLQNDIKTTVDKLKVDDPKLDQIKQILGKTVIERKDLRKIQLAVMYDVGDLNNPKTRITNFEIDTKNARLRTHQDIKLIIKNLGGTVSTDKDNNQMTDMKIKTLVNTLTNVNEATKAAAAIIVLYAENAEKMLERYKEIKNASNGLVVSDMLNAKKTLNTLKATKIDNTKLLQVVDAIADKFELKISDSEE